jgi:hypothetical protein
MSSVSYAAKADRPTSILVEPILVVPVCVSLFNFLGCIDVPVFLLPMFSHDLVAYPISKTVPLYDANFNEWSPLHSFVTMPDHGLPLEGQFLTRVFIPGVSAFVHCSDEYLNINAERNEFEASEGVHRFTDPTAGSFSYHHNFALSSTRSLQGEELLLSCSGALQHQAANEVKRIGKPVDWLKQNAICLDTLSVAPSTLPGVGRGAFNKRSVGKGEVVASTPLVHFDRSELELVEQSTEIDEKIPGAHKHGIQYTDKVIGKQLLLNYCFGHPDSNLLLLPFAPGVNFINHNSEKANAIIRWSPLSLGMGLQSYLEASPSVLLAFNLTRGILVRLSHSLELFTVLSCKAKQATNTSLPLSLYLIDTGCTD